MKIAISTLVGYFNYGNRLQNYALQKVLESMGHDVVTIRDYTYVDSSSIYTKILNKFTDGNIFKKAYQKVNFKDKKRRKRLESIRENNIKEFTKKYIKETDFYIDQNTQNFDFDKLFDCYVIGSDQVWNYTFASVSKLNFVSYSSKPKISYAASFGISEVPNKYINFYKNGLEDIDYISVRENEGKKIVEDLTSNTATVVLDPTLLLEREDWNKLISNKNKYEQKYVLIYFLGRIDKKSTKYMYEFAKKNGLTVKNLSSMLDPHLRTSDPSEFVNLISQATAVFTDSFHATVFSIIFERYFEVFPRNDNRPSMNSRMDTLLGDLHLLNQVHSNNSTLKTIDFDIPQKVIKIKRQKSLEFLENSLKMVERKING